MRLLTVELRTARQYYTAWRLQSSNGVGHAREERNTPALSTSCIARQRYSKFTSKKLGPAPSHMLHRALMEPQLRNFGFNCLDKIVDHRVDHHASDRHGGSNLLLRGKLLACVE